MRRLHIVLELFLLVTIVGCSSEPIPTPSPALTPLSLTEWKQMPVEEKYDGATLERLRMADPKLQSEQHWNAFMAREVVPERKKDIPRAPGVPAPAEQ